MINALKREIEELQSKILELIQGDIGNNITGIAKRARNRHVDFRNGTTHIVNARIENIGTMCYLNAYLQVIASCPILPNYLLNTPTLSLRNFPLYCALATLMSSLVSENEMKEIVDPTVFSKSSLLHVLISFRNLVQVNVSYVSAICSKYAYSHYDYCLTLTICTSV
jgi:hypothetical protein